MDSTRRGLGTVLLCLLVLGSGCLTAQPTIRTEPTESPVFESVTTTDEWGTTSIQVTVRLTPAATTDRGVSKLSVISADGGSFYSTSLDGGQRVVSIPVPTGESRVYAMNTVNGTVVDTVNVTVDGTTLP